MWLDIVEACATTASGCWTNMPTCPLAAKQRFSVSSLLVTSWGPQMRRVQPPCWLMVVGCDAMLYILQKCILIYKYININMYIYMHISMYTHIYMLYIYIYRYHYSWAEVVGIQREGAKGTEANGMSAVINGIHMSRGVLTVVSDMTSGFPVLFSETLCRTPP